MVGDSGLPRRGTRTPLVGPNAGRRLAGLSGSSLRDTNMTMQLALSVDDPIHQKIATLLQGGDVAPAMDGCCALTISEAAARCKYSRMTIYRALKAGVLRSVTPIPGGRQRILESDLLAWLRGSRPSSATGDADQTRIGR